VVFTRERDVLCEEHGTVIPHKDMLKKRKDAGLRRHHPLPFSDRDLSQLSPELLGEVRRIHRWLMQRKSIVEGRAFDKFVSTGAMCWSLRLGALSVESLGVFPLTSPTTALSLWDQGLIVPVNFRCKRLFPSYLHPARYSFVSFETAVSVRDAPHVSWTVAVDDDPLNPISSSSLGDALALYLKRVHSFRKEHNLPPIPKCHFYFKDPCSFLGLHHPVLRKAIESLPNAATASHRYAFKYIPRNAAAKNCDMSLQYPLSLHKLCGALTFQTTCARSDGPLAIKRRKWTSDAQLERALSPVLHTRPALGSSIAKSSALMADAQSGPNTPPLPGTPASAASSNSSNMTNFLIPVRAKYRAMKQNERYALRVMPSKIAGLGLYCTRPFEKDDMVVEYVGEIIGQKLADLRELEYERRRKGYYMFSLEYDQIIDATMKGNKGRFINHSCEVRATVYN
jgi:hypothetical protein